MGIDLSLIWILIIAFGLMMYVVMDGSDLGIGILFPFVSATSDRDTMVNTVAPVWDGNETWLALGGAGLLAAFPRAYGILLSALYIPVVLMLMGRSCAAWRSSSVSRRTTRTDRSGTFAFSGGSYLAAFCQGAALGAFVNGFTVNGAFYDGGALDWLTPFSVFTGIGVIVAYALLGGTWLNEDRGRAAGADDRAVPPIVPVAAVGNRLGQPVDSAGRR